jgi:hypothetical protein
VANFTEPLQQVLFVKSCFTKNSFRPLLLGIQIFISVKKIIYFISIPLSILTSLQCDDGNPYKHGKILYANFCMNCHMENGEGLKGLIPPLVKADYLTTHRSDIPCNIRNGMKGKLIVNGVEYGQQEMLPIKKLTESEIANIMNYISTSWGNNEKLWTLEEVRQGLDKCQKQEY